MENILLVTFTRAATFELKLRLRRNLEQKKLIKALSKFDSLSIFTIHGFCFHTLKEFAFESDFPLNQNEESVKPELLCSLLHDFLSNELDPDEIHPRQLEKVVKKCHSQLEKLYQELQHPSSILGRTFREIWNEIVEERRRLTSDPLFSPKQRSTLFEQLLNAAPCFAGLCDRKRLVKEEHIKGFDRFVTLLHGEEVNPVDLPCLKMIPENLIRNHTYPLWLEKLNRRLIPLLTELSDPVPILGRLKKEAQEYVTTRCEREDLFFYDDLVKRLAQQLENPLFCEKVRSKYKIVLIDEFQDTDSLQWKIFSTLFLHHAPLYTVGDPKQSIYGFRGADLYVYKEAQKALGSDAMATLNQNFRSQPPLVAGLNTLFAQAGALITLPKINEVIPIDPVIAALENTSSAGIIFCEAETEEELFSTICHEIERVHHEENIPYREIAILVKDRYQGGRFASHCPLPYVNKRSESLADSEAFIAFEDFLLAIYYPRDRGYLVKALGGPLFQTPIAEIVTHLEERSSRFFYYRKILIAQGLLALLETVREELCFPNHGFYLDFLHVAEFISEHASTFEE